MPKWWWPNHRFQTQVQSVSFENVKSKAFEKTKKCAKRRRGQVTLKTAKVPQIAGKTVVAHGVWKSQKKSHSTLRAKRAKSTFWVDKSSLQMPKMVHFGEFLKTWSLRSNSVTRQVSFNMKKVGGKCQNSKIQIRHFE